MLRKKYMYGINGEISQIFPTESAEIKFDLQGTPELALLKKGRYYHNGRLIPDNVPLSKYIRKDMQVKFSCHVLDRQDSEGMDLLHQTTYRWYAIMCWPNKDYSTANLPKTEVSISMGLVSVPSTVSSITKRHGILMTLDNSQNEHSISFLASKVYIHGKRFSSSKMLSTQLSIDDKMFCDAIPCIPEEDKDNCRYFATCVFQGKRPRLVQPMDNDFQANCLVQALQKTNDISGNSDNDGNQDNRLSQFGQQTQQTNFKSQLLKIINLHTSNPRTLFSSGYGFIFDILNDEFGIIIGCFKSNVYQTILFHRKNAFLFQISLARAKLTEIFVEGDRMRFIAVGAPSNFITDWIAVQVAVAGSSPEIGDTRQL